MDFKEVFYLFENTDQEGRKIIPIPKTSRIKVKKKNLYRDHLNRLKVKIPSGYALKTDPKGQKWLIKKRIKSGDAQGPKSDSTIEWEEEKGAFVYVVDRQGAMKKWRQMKLLNKRTAKKRALSAAKTRRRNKK